MVKSTCEAFIISESGIKVFNNNKVVSNSQINKGISNNSYMTEVSGNKKEIVVSSQHNTSDSRKIETIISPQLTTEEEYPLIKNFPKNHGGNNQGQYQGNRSKSSRFGSFFSLLFSKRNSQSEGKR